MFEYVYFESNNVYAYPGVFNNNTFLFYASLIKSITIG